MTEYLHELDTRPSRTTLDILVHVLGKLDSYHHTSPDDRARRFSALLSLSGKQVLDAVPIPRAIK